jgi:hypothetical protein
MRQNRVGRNAQPDGRPTSLFFAFRIRFSMYTFLGPPARNRKTIGRDYTGKLTRPEQGLARLLPWLCNVYYAILTGFQ